MSKEQRDIDDGNGGDASAPAEAAQADRPSVENDGRVSAPGNGMETAGVNDEPGQTPVDSARDEVEDDIEALKQALETQKQETADNLLRARAEMENLRKRTFRDIENAHKYALEKFVHELLPVIDSLEQGLSAFESTENIADLREGIDLTLKKFTGVAEKFGIQTIDPNGEKFNPEQHEAVSTRAVEGQGAGVVVEVMRKGYQLNDRLVRPAMVIVAK